MIHNLKIEWNKNYGIDRRTGWSVSINGMYVVELEKWLIVALMRAWFTWRRWHKDEVQFMSQYSQR